jgi:prephenate dehydrogenase
MAGTTSAGFSAADPGLFRGRAFLLVPTARSDDGAMAIAGTIVRDVGGIVTVCSTDVHDRAMARLVAGPLAAAAALAVAGAQAEPLLRAAGPGFRDSTRLADTPADLATELLFGNADDAAAAIGSIVEGLTQLRDAVERGDREYARSFLAAARSVRSELG